MTDEARLRAAPQRPLQVLDGPAIPGALIDRAAGLRIRQVRHVQVQHDRTAQLARLVVNLQTARVVKQDPELPLAADPDAVDVIGGFQEPGRLG